MIGTSPRRKEDQRLLSGGGRFVDDLTRDGLLHLGVVRSAEAHARIVKVGLDRARKAPGVVAAWSAGADVVKIFPCGAVGGASYIKSLKAPLPQVEMIPTGGVNLETAGEFLKAGACAVAVGGELVDARSIKEGRYDIIEERTRQYLAVIAKARAGM